MVCTLAGKCDAAVTGTGWKGGEGIGIHGERQRSEVVLVERDRVEGIAGKAGGVHEAGVHAAGYAAEKERQWGGLEEG